MVDAVTRNLGLHYLSEGRVDEACPLLRECLETLEKTLRPDMARGDESLDLIPPLMVLSYAEMLAGNKRHPAVSADGAVSSIVRSIFNLCPLCVMQLQVLRMT